MFTKAQRLLPWLLALAIAAPTLWSWCSHGLVFDLLRSDWEAAAKIERLRSFFLDCGGWAPLVYVGLVTVEVVVAPIPGLMLYAPGGLIFGPVLGGTLALAGNVLGAGIACTLARSLNVGPVRRFVSSQRVEPIQAAVAKRGSWLIFLLRLNPLTSSDLVSYAAGLTRIPTWRVMAATGCGMAPLCFAQASLSDSLFQTFPALIYPLLAACLVYVAVVLAVLRRLAGGSDPRLALSCPTDDEDMRKQVPGFVRNVRFRNVSIEGAPGEYLVQLEGADAEHSVRDVTFDKVTINGQPLAAGQDRQRIGQHVEGVHFQGEP